MRYLISIETPNEVSATLAERPEEAKKAMGVILEKWKPEAAYFSTIRRLAIFIVNVEDPHVELRRLYEELSKYGSVTVDPVSTLNEFLAYWEKMA